MNPPRPPAKRVYDVMLVLFAGPAIGWFAWWFGGSYGGAESPPLLLFVLAAMVATFLVVRWLRQRSPSGRSWWVHLLWIPVVLFVALMAAVIMALRNWQ